MRQNPIFLATQFLLEVVALVALGYWAWTTQTGAVQFIMVVGLPLLMAIIWAVFRAKHDPKAIIGVPGMLRLALELALLSLSIVLLVLVDKTPLAIGLATFIVLQYLITYDHVLWLIRGR